MFDDTYLWTLVGNGFKGLRDGEAPAAHARSRRARRLNVDTWLLGVAYDRPRVSFSPPRISSLSGAEHDSPLQHVSAFLLANCFALNEKETCANFNVLERGLPCIT